MKLTAAVAALALAATAYAAPPLAVTEATGDGDYTDASGLWETTVGASVLRFERTAGARDAYSVTVVEAAAYDIAPGTLIGSLTATATDGTYDAEFLADPLGKSLTGRKHHFIVEFEPDLRSCTFRSYRKGRRLSLRRLLPYLFRVAVVSDDTRPEGIDGAVRLDSPAIPVIL